MPLVRAVRRWECARIVQTDCDHLSDRCQVRLPAERLLELGQPSGFPHPAQSKLEYPLSPVAHWALCPFGWWYPLEILGVATNRQGEPQECPRCRARMTILVLAGWVRKRWRGAIEMVTDSRFADHCRRCRLDGWPRPTRVRRGTSVAPVAWESPST